MKCGQLMLWLALALALGACQPPSEAPPMEAAPTFSAEDEAAIRERLEAYVADVKAADSASHAGYYAEGAVRMPPDEPMIQGRAAITEWIEALPPVTDFTLTPQVVAGEGDLAWARGAFTLDLAPPDAEPVRMVGKWQGVYERQANGSWLCVSDIWNRDTPPEM